MYRFINTITTEVRPWFILPVIIFMNTMRIDRITYCQYHPNFKILFIAKGTQNLTDGFENDLSVIFRRKHSFQTAKISLYQNKSPIVCKGDLHYNDYKNALSISQRFMGHDGRPNY